MTLSRICLVLFILVKACDLVLGHRSYQALIPNGNKVSDPCGNELSWKGVGHLTATGGGRLNPFGVDFLQEGKKWTTALCLLDSDGDGRRNGEELGDPFCKWKMGEVPERVINITHPGLCEPINSRRCQQRQSWIKCPFGNDCPAKNDIETLIFDAAFPSSLIPAKETSYYCKTFVLPDDKDYHIVATEPLINTPSAVHHMDLYACSDLDHMPHEDRPFECMMGAKCSEMIAGWALGERGLCTDNFSGIRFGKSSFKFIRLQIHWNNEGAAPNKYDNSGLRLFYTSKLRKHDLGQLISAQLFLRIPPRQKKVTTDPAVCSSECTKSFLPHPILVTGVNLHMHFAGKSIFLEQYRNGKKIRDLARDNDFDYNSPKYFHFEKPFQIHPGDELRTQCIYHSEQRNEITYDGYGAYQEMCFAFIYYYPRVEYSGLKCASLERHSYCEIEEMEDYSYLYKHNFGQCNLTAFEAKGYVKNVLHSCGYYPEVCSPKCKRNVDIMFNHDCMQGVLGTHFKEAKTEQDIAIALSVWRAEKVCANYQPPKIEKAAGEKHQSNVFVFITVISFIALFYPC